MAVAYLQEQPSPRILRYREARSSPCVGNITDVFPCAGGRATMMIADVGGHDSSAERYASYLRYAIRALADDYGPARVLERANRAFYRRLAGDEDNRFARAFVATLTGRWLTYAFAGHDCALLLRPNGQRHDLPPTGLVIGRNETEGYRERVLTVAPGDWLVLVTNGVTNARDDAGAFFGSHGIAQNAHSAIAAGFDDPASWILERAQKHGRFNDDAAVLGVRFS
jgi:sigma-B regulation protein RsbU (phosphoserine phosphatase)